MSKSFLLLNVCLALAVCSHGQSSKHACGLETGYSRFIGDRDNSEYAYANTVGLAWQYNLSKRFDVRLTWLANRTEGFYVRDRNTFPSGSIGSTYVGLGSVLRTEVGVIPYISKNSKHRISILVGHSMEDRFRTKRDVRSLDTNELISSSVSKSKKIDLLKSFSGGFEYAFCFAERWKASIGVRGFWWYDEGSRFNGFNDFPNAHLRLLRTF